MVLGSLDEHPVLLTIEEAAAVLRIGRSLAYELARLELEQIACGGRDDGAVGCLGSTIGRLGGRVGVEVGWFQNR